MLLSGIFSSPSPATPMPRATPATAGSVDSNAWPTTDSEGATSETSPSTRRRNDAFNHLMLEAASSKGATKVDAVALEDKLKKEFEELIAKKSKKYLKKCINSYAYHAIKGKDHRNAWVECIAMQRSTHSRAYSDPNAPEYCFGLTPLVELEVSVVIYELEDATRHLKCLKDAMKEKGYRLVKLIESKIEKIEACLVWWENFARLFGLYRRSSVGEKEEATDKITLQFSFRLLIENYSKNLTEGGHTSAEDIEKLKRWSENLNKAYDRFDNDKKNSKTAEEVELARTAFMASLTDDLADEDEAKKRLLYLTAISYRFVR